MRFLVTGGAGFIGSHLVEELLRRNHQVRVLDNFSSGTRDNLQSVLHNENLEILEGDVRDAAAVGRAVSAMDGIFHEAALVSVPASIERPDLSLEINAKGALHVFDAARAAGVRRVVFASSAAVYGDNPELPLKETFAPRPLSPYGLDKLYSEHLGTLFSSLYGLETIALRYFNVYGPRQDPRSPYSGVISVFVQRLESGQSPTVFGDGEQTRDFVYVADVVEANLRAMFAAWHGFRVFNVANGRQTSLNELLSELRALMGSSQTAVYAEARAGDIRHSLGDISRTQTELGYAPAYGLREGLRLLVNG